MKYIIILLITVPSLISCSSSRYGCGNWKDVQRHDSRPFRAGVILKEGTITTNENYVRTTLISVTRTMKGLRHLFITDNGDSIVKYFNQKLVVNECYLVKS